MARSILSTIKAAPFLNNMINGFVTENDVSDLNNAIKVNIGVCSNSTNTGYINLNSTIIKKLNAVWAVGSNVGGLDTGVKAVSSTYHLFVIKNITTGVVDSLFSLSASAPTLPTGYTFFRRIASMVTDASGNIRNYVQKGNVFSLQTPFLQIDTAATNALLYVGCPTGVVLEAFGQVGTRMLADGAIGMTTAADADTTSSGPDFANGTAQYSRFGFGGGRLAGDFGSQHLHGSFVSLTTNTSGQLRFRGSGSTNMSWYLMGWKDFRGL